MDPALKEELLSLDDNYRGETVQLIRFLEERGLELDRTGLAAWAEHLKTGTLAASTIARQLAAAKHRLRYLFRKTSQAHDPVAGFELEEALREFRAPRKASREVDLQKCLSLEELRRLLDSKKVTDRVKLFIRFLARTGLRVSEMAGIRLERIAPEKDGYDRIRILGKGSKERMIRAPRELLTQIVHEFGGETYLFETVHGQPFSRQYISGAIHEAGLVVLGRSISAHTLRHTFATLQISKHRKIKAISLFLGHSTTAITQDMYVHEELDLEDLDMGL